MSNKIYINILKAFLIGLILFLFFTTIYIPFIWIARISVILIILYTFISLYYYSFKANKENREILFKMWKVYISTVILMLVFFYNIEKNNQNFIFEREIIKFNYELKTGAKKEANTTYSEYIKHTDKIINGFKLKEVSNPYKENTKQKENEETTDNKYIWYANLSINTINIMTLFMFLWALVEFVPKNIKTRKAKYLFLSIQRKKLHSSCQIYTPVKITPKG